MSTSKKQTTSVIEVLSPIEQEAAVQSVRFAAMAGGLSSWERHKLEWQAKRQRSQLIGQLIEIEKATVLGEAVEQGRGRVAAAEERADLAVHAERVSCVVEAGQLHEEAQAATRQLSEDSRELIQGAIDHVTIQYVRGAERRSSGCSP